MTDSIQRETLIEDRICLTLIMGAFLWLFLLTVDLSKANPSFVPEPPACVYNCR